MSSETTPRIRKAPLPAAALLVVRGDALDPDLLRRDAQLFTRRFPQWDRTGVSGFYAANAAEVDALCADKLARFPTVVIFDREDLAAAGIDIVATFRTPHVTLAAPDTQTLIARLLSCPHRNEVNAYHERDDEEDR